MRHLLTFDFMARLLGVWALMRRRSAGTLTTADVEAFARRQEVSRRTVERWLSAAERDAHRRDASIEAGGHGPDAPPRDTE
jgi:hypothetical protein